MINIGNRISAIRAARGLSMRDVCNRLDWEHTSRLSQYENNNREPTLAILENIADALDVSLRELMFGQDSTAQASAVADEHGTIHIELQRLVSNGVWQASGKIITINKDMLPNNTTISALRGIQIENDHMEPYLSKGDVALVDTMYHEIVDGAVFMIGFNNSWVIRRAYSMPADAVLLNPDNQRHPPMNTLSSAIQVLGRVIWRGG
ncbi:XRE family transcriptional regulator [Chromobacterium violaceum]|uniref:XRE family transcriptional regulator n=1 Tax=Chromobacterium violaceum TaxID=536 RepID=UPI00194FC016|nr:LexA family transcriptional regulator [Chromobacterium violaceum]QRO34151.1 LexA family transcriptional regulator [Chromobacterium violaceum]QRQ16046.1 LexA family transcriptional regulator [Chromobacterium violaceum]